MSREQRKLKATRRQVTRQSALMMSAAHQLHTANLNIERTQARNDFWRNLMVASAFARGLGNERPISEIIEDAQPALLRSYE